MRQRALLFINLHARRGEEQCQKATRWLQELGFDLIEHKIDGNPEHISEQIRQHRHEIDLVIVGGGDGTLNAALEALVETQLPLGILPLGTANDLARTLDIPESLLEACRIIAAGHLRRIDLGLVNDKYFLTVASLGLSGQLARQVTRAAKRRWGMLAYAVAAIKLIRETQPFHAEIRISDRTFKVQTLQITVGNGRFYGGGMAIANDARIDDERLDLCSLEVQHWWEMLTLPLALRQGRYLQQWGIRTLQGQDIEIITDHPHVIDTDGELTTQTPARFQLVPKAISVFVPFSRLAASI
jgi:diacylglycerol kinase (ATP)